ncbi:vicilin-like, partial [Trifolium medium]|nr:vicilin-like [Trifolium medium]
KAILTVLNSNGRNSFNLERGDTIKLPAGTIIYLANRDDNEDLRVLDLAIPVNRPGQFQVKTNNPSYLGSAKIF